MQKGGEERDGLSPFFPPHLFACVALIFVFCVVTSGYTLCLNPELSGVVVIFSLSLPDAKSTICATRAKYLSEAPLQNCGSSGTSQDTAMGICFIPLHHLEEHFWHAVPLKSHPTSRMGSFGVRGTHRAKVGSTLNLR